MALPGRWRAFSVFEGQRCPPLRRSHFPPRCRIMSEPGRRQRCALIRLLIDREDREAAVDYLMG